MRIFSALVRREIFEQRLLLLVSGILGLVPIVLPLLPGSIERFSPEDLRVAVLMVMVVLFGGVTLLILGATIVGRDLSEGRLAFYFSRPVSGWVLWASRMFAAWILLLGSLLLMIGPTAIAGQWFENLSDRPSGRGWPFLAFEEVFSRYTEVPEALSTPGRLAYVLAAILLLLALTHAVSTIVRARSLWILADLAGLLVFVGIIWAVRDELVREQAIGALAWVERGLLPWILGSLLLAGGLQLTRGRTDLRRGHRFLSATLWPMLIAGALGFSAYGNWITTGTIDDLEHLSFAQASPKEDWLLAGGRLRHRAGAAAAFLLKVDPEGEVRSQRSWRLGNLSVVRHWQKFSSDGGTVVWAGCERFRPLDCELWAKDLRDAESPPRRTGVPITDSIQMALSADGSRLAIAEERRIVVYELSSARALTVVPAHGPRSIGFVSHDLVQYHEQDEQDDWKLWLLDLRTRRSVEVGSLPDGMLKRRNRVRDTVLYNRFSPPGFGLYRGDTGEPLFELEMPWPHRARFLADDRIVLSVHEMPGVELMVLAPDGREEHRIERPAATGSRFGGEIEPGRVLVALRDGKRAGDRDAGEDEADEDADLTFFGIGSWTTYVLDAGTGELTPLLDNAVPLGAPARIPDRRLLQAGGEVIQWHPRTGERRTLLPAAGR